MLSGSLAFAIMASLAHALKQNCTWQVIALVRSSLAFLFAVLLVKAAGASLVVWKPGTLWVRSIAGSISMVCTFFALPQLPVADVLTLTNMFPIWVAILCWPTLGEVPTVSVWASAVSGIAGVALIQQPHFTQGNYACFVAVLGSFATAVAMLGLHRLSWIDPRSIVAHFSGVAVVFCLGSLFLFERTVPVAGTWELPVLGLLLGVGLTATIGQLCLTKAFTSGPPAKVAVVGLSQIVFALVFDVLFFGRSLSWPTFLGIVLVVSPTLWLLTHRETLGK